ncbi:hypothetical protein BD770DRAFT_447848 [Pilaira anomala]|nr:hypothetical protein BD770DRAFT_447848 [Pilaira anomala]
MRSTFTLIFLALTIFLVLGVESRVALDKRLLDGDILTGDILEKGILNGDDAINMHSTLALLFTLTLFLMLGVESRVAFDKRRLEPVIFENQVALDQSGEYIVYDHAFE